MTGKAKQTKNRTPGGKFKPGVHAGKLGNKNAMKSGKKK